MKGGILLSWENFKEKKKYEDFKMRGSADLAITRVGGRMRWKEQRFPGNIGF
jgi:hypothetical protein